MAELQAHVHGEYPASIVVHVPNDAPTTVKGYLIMKSKSPISARAVLLGAGLLCATVSQVMAEDPATSFSIEAGPALGQASVPGGDIDLAGLAVGAKWEVCELLFSKFSLRADYLHLDSQDTAPFQRDELDVDARFGMSFVGFLNPYIGAGISVARNDAFAYTPEDDWTPGFGLGAGIGITILPGLLHTTPSVRYADFKDLRTMTYTLDTALHFTIIGVGLRLDYEDNLSRDADMFRGVLYAAVRF
jgi:opacity protein-like surface antigen